MNKNLLMTAFAVFAFATNVSATTNVEKVKAFVNDKYVRTVGKLPKKVRIALGVTAAVAATYVAAGLTYAAHGQYKQGFPTPAQKQALTDAEAMADDTPVVTGKKGGEGLDKDDMVVVKPATTAKADALAAARDDLAPFALRARAARAARNTAFGPAAFVARHVPYFTSISGSDFAKNN